MSQRIDDLNESEKIQLCINSVFALSKQSVCVDEFRQWFEDSEEQYDIQLFVQPDVIDELEALQNLQNCFDSFANATAQINIATDNIIKIIIRYLDYLKQQENSRKLAFAARDVLLSMPYLISKYNARDMEQLVKNYADAIKVVHEVLLDDLKVSCAKLEKVVAQQSEYIANLDDDIKGLKEKVYG